MTRSVLLAVGMLLASGSASADVRLDEAWLRPAYAGQPVATIYVDIHSTRALKLVGASSPVARRAALVLVDPPGADATQKVVRELPVAANGATRLAYLGSHVRLIDIGRDLKPGDSIPVTLSFVDANGERLAATTEARVRGIGARRPPAIAPK